MVNLPVFLTSAVARAAKSSSTLAHCAFLRPLFEAKLSAMAPLVKAFADTAFFFITFMAFTIFREVEKKWPVV